MAKDCQNIYRVARCLAKMQRLQAAEELAISESSLRKYEAEQCQDMPGSDTKPVTVHNKRKSRRCWNTNGLQKGCLNGQC